MVGEVRRVLLSKILSMEGVFEAKYSTAYNSIKAVFELESKEKGKDKLPREIFEKFEEILAISNNLDERLEGFPLIVVEQYLFRNSSNLEKYVYLMYENKEQGDLKVLDLYKILEDFFSKIYLLAVEVSDYYSIEIKLKDTKSKNAQSDDSSFI